MSPRKSRPLLWELSREPGRTPGGRLRPNRPARPEVPRPEPTTSGGPEVETANPVGAAGAPAEPVFETEIMSPVETDAFGLHLHLRWPAAGITAAALFLLLLGSFAVGRATAPSAGNVEKQAAATQPANDKPVARSLVDAPRTNLPAVPPPRATPAPTSREAAPPVRPEPAKESSPSEHGRTAETHPAKPPETQPAEEEPTGPLKLKSGFTYIVVQHFPKSQRTAAEKAAAFLHEKGVFTGILGGADIRLIVNEEFDLKSENSTRARQEHDRLRQWLEYVKKLGGEYDKIGGYDFAKAYSQEEH